MQINRLFEIVYILLEKQTVTAAELADKLEVSARTIYRDVETLSQAKIPIYMSKGKGGGISLLPDFILNKAVLTEQEKSDVLSSMKAVSAVNLLKSDSALNKLNNMLGKKNSDWIEVDFSSWGYFENDAGCFEKIKTAIIEKQVITFMYASGKAEKLKREIMPLKLVFKSAAWYLYGFCKMREDYRFFKLRRIDSLFITDDHFDLTAPESILNEQKIDTSLYIKAELVISKKMAFRVYDEISSYKINENGDFLCKLYLPDINTVCNYASSFGEYCTILSPAEAIEDMKRRLENSLKNYL
ncbi:MAG: YafY family protein [Oscillospiraceae bacterium]|jgi:predicted DNA-binding transcriptional regulator YafY